MTISGHVESATRAGLVRPEAVTGHGARRLGMAPVLHDRRMGPFDGCGWMAGVALTEADCTSAMCLLADGGLGTAGVAGDAGGSGGSPRSTRPRKADEVEPLRRRRGSEVHRRMLEERRLNASPASTTTTAPPSGNAVCPTTFATRPTAPGTARVARSTPKLRLGSAKAESATASSRGSKS